MNIKLTSDYIDYYDHWFDREGKEFRRVSAVGSGPTRAEAFLILKNKLGEAVIPHGIVKDFADGRNLVVYIDQYKHAGNGKLLLTSEEALKDYPDYLSSLFIQTSTKHAVSYKYLRIGMHHFYLKITADEDWRTNVDALDIDILGHSISSEKDYSMRTRFAPVYAIDYVVDPQTGIRYAIDLNLAPGCRNLGVKDYLSPKDAVDSIKQWFELYGDPVIIT